MDILSFKNKKNRQEKITFVTCYDYSSAKILNSSQVDAILVGDSLAMTIYGEKTTLPATIETMAAHTAAVARGAPDKFIVGDLPFLSYRMSLDENMRSISKIMLAGAHAVKLEGLLGNEELIRHTVQSGIPVMGHLGLTPQSVHQLGGFRVQGKEKSQADLILEHAIGLQECGCFSIVLECVPNLLAKHITEKLEIPTIGIGAGPDTDGQILVWQDLLGINSDFKPKFVRQYLNAGELMLTALNKYADDVKTKNFPSIKESYE